MAGSLVSVVDAIHQGSKEALALIDGRNRVHLIQDGAPVTRLLGMPPRRIVQDPLSIIHPDDIDAVQQTFLATRRVAEASTSVHFRAMGERGEVALVATFTNYLERRELRALVVRVRQDEAVPMSSPPPSVRSSATSNVDIIPDVWLDAGLVTMTQLLDATDQAVQRHREGSLRGFSMLLVEVNNYRRIQNAFSHEVVEELVVQIHGRFRPLLGDRDQVAVRNDGLFAILLLGIGDGVKAERLGEKFLRAVQAPFNVDDAVLKVEPMVGLATSERTYTNGEAVFRDASSAIGSAAKTKGRRKLAAFRTQIRSDERDQITLLAEMSRGLEADEFRCVYQPIVDLKSRALTGFEALVRWRHPSRGELGPGVFINLAEETGFIEALGEWVLRSSCRQMAQWYRAYPNARGLSVSVNVSGVQLGNPQLLSVVENALRESQLPPEALHLELTENTVLEDVERAAAAVARLQLYGVSFSLDDFGTGYSSLALLHRMDYEHLKIDKSFVGEGWETNQTIVRAIIQMAHGLGIKVIAEGVETNEQFSALSELNCDFGQGYLFSTPLSEGAVTRLLSERRRL